MLSYISILITSLLGILAILFNTNKTDNKLVKPLNNWGKTLIVVLLISSVITISLELDKEKQNLTKSEIQKRKFRIDSLNHLMTISALGKQKIIDSIQQLETITALEFEKRQMKELLKLNKINHKEQQSLYHFNTQILSDKSSLNSNLIQSVKLQNEFLSKQNQELKKANLYLKRFLEGIKTIDIKINSNNSEFLAYEYVFLFTGEGEPWGFKLNNKSISLFLGNTALDNIIAASSIPFKIGYTGLEENGPPDSEEEYLAPSEYLIYDSTHIWLRTNINDLHLSEENYNYQYFLMGFKGDMVKSKKLEVKIYPKDIEEHRNEFKINQISIKINEGQNMELLSEPKALKFFLREDTRLGEKYRSIMYDLPDNWL